MSQQEVERLQALLSRVQENRDVKRTLQGATAPVVRTAQAASPAPRSLPPAAPAPPKATPMAVPMVVKPAIAEPAFKPSFADPPAAVASRPAETTPSRRPGQDRSPTPLEMAVAELDFASPAAPAAARRDPLAAVTVGTLVAAPEYVSDELTHPHVIEPEAMRESGRPIAQVVSRHSPQVDATFGAMLKRSLSLRPH